jgi:hypothetical protein
MIATLDQHCQTFVNPPQESSVVGPNAASIREFHRGFVKWRSLGATHEPATPTLPRLRNHGAPSRHGIRFYRAHDPTPHRRPGTVFYVRGIAKGLGAKLARRGGCRMLLRFRGESSSFSSSSDSSTLQQRRIHRRTGAPGRTRTSDHRLRRPPLYPAELRARVAACLAPYPSAVNWGRRSL